MGNKFKINNLFSNVDVECTILRTTYYLNLYIPWLIVFTETYNLLLCFTISLLLFVMVLFQSDQLTGVQAVLTFKTQVLMGNN